MGYIKDLEMFLNKIGDSKKADKLMEIINWIKAHYPNLVLEIKWNQPMFTNEGTFIISFSTSTNHISVAPELVSMEKFSKDIEEAGYSQSKMLFRIKYSDDVNYDLLRKIIDFNIEDKKGMTKFWR